MDPSNATRMREMMMAAAGEGSPGGNRENTLINDGGTKHHHHQGGAESDEMMMMMEKAHQHLMGPSAATLPELYPLSSMEAQLDTSRYRSFSNADVDPFDRVGEEQDFVLRKRKRGVVEPLNYCGIGGGGSVNNKQSSSSSSSNRSKGGKAAMAIMAGSSSSSCVITGFPKGTHNNPIARANRQYACLRWLETSPDYTDVLMRFELERRVGATPTVACYNELIKLLVRRQTLQNHTKEQVGRGRGGGWELLSVLDNMVLDGITPSLTTYLMMIEGLLAAPSAAAVGGRNHSSSGGRVVAARVAIHAQSLCGIQIPCDVWVNILQTLLTSVDADDESVRKSSRSLLLQRPPHEDYDDDGVAVDMASIIMSKVVDDASAVVSQLPFVHHIYHCAHLTRRGQKKQKEQDSRASHRATNEALRVFRTHLLPFATTTTTLNTTTTSSNNNPPPVMILAAVNDRLSVLLESLILLVCSSSCGTVMMKRVGDDDEEDPEECDTAERGEEEERHHRLMSMMMTNKFTFLGTEVVSFAQSLGLPQLSMHVTKSMIRSCAADYMTLVSLSSSSKKNSSTQKTMSTTQEEEEVKEDVETLKGHCLNVLRSCVHHLLHLTATSLSSSSSSMVDNKTAKKRTSGSQQNDSSTSFDETMSSLSMMDDDAVLYNFATTQLSSSNSVVMDVTTLHWLSKLYISLNNDSNSNNNNNNDTIVSWGSLMSLWRLYLAASLLRVRQRQQSEEVASRRKHKMMMMMNQHSGGGGQASQQRQTDDVITALQRGKVLHSDDDASGGRKKRQRGEEEGEEGTADEDNTVMGNDDDDRDVLSSSPQNRRDMATRVLLDLMMMVMKNDRGEEEQKMMMMMERVTSIVNLLFPFLRAFHQDQSSSPSSPSSASSSSALWPSLSSTMDFPVDLQRVLYHVFAVVHQSSNMMMMVSQSSTSLYQTKKRLMWLLQQLNVVTLRCFMEPHLVGIPAAAAATTASSQPPVNRKEKGGGGRLPTTTPQSGAAGTTMPASSSPEVILQQILEKYAKSSYMLKLFASTSKEADDPLATDEGSKDDEEGAASWLLTLESKLSVEALMLMGKRGTDGDLYVPLCHSSAILSIATDASALRAITAMMKSYENKGGGAMLVLPFDQLLSIYADPKISPEHKRDTFRLVGQWLRKGFEWFTVGTYSSSVASALTIMVQTPTTTTTTAQAATLPPTQTTTTTTSSDVTVDWKDRLITDTMKGIRSIHKKVAMISNDPVYEKYAKEEQGLAPVINLAELIKRLGGK